MLFGGQERQHADRFILDDQRYSQIGDQPVLAIKRPAQNSLIGLQVADDQKLFGAEDRSEDRVMGA